ncbi:drug/metabolite transporter (DMT)-like permease [Sporomusaceae bacterium BoRhaA]|uniref:DMT family transporter n=1 Tax=Pelorhabdus rhamnosifermentans TaxID=2772457 RepID=UPI001C064920|nr:DMT family transporter [Pelorhabdus rhamnosifermentans]MBU2699300.1 drug/metabolite transporter (DMT)-like permease [Pelorhabdus rhamnosifermentans]
MYIALVTSTFLISQYHAKWMVLHAFFEIFAICIGNFMWIWGIGKIGSNRTAIYNNLSPIFAIITGYFLLGETIELWQLIGGVAVLWGVYLMRKSKISIVQSTAMK